MTKFDEALLLLRDKCELEEEHALLAIAALQAATARMILNADDTREVCELMDLADKSGNCRKAEADFAALYDKGGEGKPAP